MSDSIERATYSEVGWIRPMFFAAMAGAMAWGIRGQYGHETGAMIAGLLICLTLTFLLCPNARASRVVRAVAMGTVAMGFGGSMTYGSTVGLTHDAPLIGNFAALSWGLLGLSIKGGIWIGFAGVFFGMGLSGVRYRPHQIALVMLALVGAYMIGVALLNSPFDPGRRALPLIYFSDHWRWEPEANVRPRLELWGGLLLALVMLIVYVSRVHGDRLARNLALWGVLGGAVGFPLGQSFQAFHAWNQELFTRGFWAELAPHMNWWNMMETTFGAIMGAALGLGLWLNRRLINLDDDSDEPAMSDGFLALLLCVHLSLVIAVEFTSIRSVDRIYDLGLMMGIIPMFACVSGGLWRYLQILPITRIPSAGKTLRQLVYREEAIGPLAGWVLYLVVPLTIATFVAFDLVRRAEAGQTAHRLTRVALLVTAWTYFLLNYAFFRYPFPWREWTGRTPNGIVFSVCVLGLTLLVLALDPRKRARAAPSR